MSHSFECSILGAGISGFTIARRLKNNPSASACGCLIRRKSLKKTQYKYHVHLWVLEWLFDMNWMVEKSAGDHPQECN